jgi:hypothetical protein
MCGRGPLAVEISARHPGLPLRFGDIDRTGDELHAMQRIGDSLLANQQFTAQRNAGRRKIVARHCAAIAAREPSRTPVFGALLVQRSVAANGIGPVRCGERGAEEYRPSRPSRRLRRPRSTPDVPRCGSRRRPSLRRRLAPPGRGRSRAAYGPKESACPCALRDRSPPRRRGSRAAA